MRNHYDLNTKASILPFFFLILGLITFFRNHAFISLMPEDGGAYFLFAWLFCSYFLLGDSYLVIINCCTLASTSLGMLFFTDLIYGPGHTDHQTAFVTAALLLLCVFINTLLLLYVRSNKRPDEYSSQRAVKEALEKHIFILGIVSVLVLLLMGAALDFLPGKILLLALCLCMVFFVNSAMLLPLLCRSMLCSLNEERMQDDLEYSNVEKMKVHVQRTADKYADKTVSVCRKHLHGKVAAAMAAFTAAAAAVYFTASQPKSDAWQNEAAIIFSLVFFFISVYRCKSYILGAAPTLFVLAGYYLFSEICGYYFGSSIYMLRISLFAVMIVLGAGVYLLTDYSFCALSGDSASGALPDDALRVFAMLLRAVLILISAVIFAALHLYRSEADFYNCFGAAAILLSAVLFPVTFFPGVLALAGERYLHARRPRNQKIKSIYL